MTKESVQQLLCHCSCHLVVTTPMEHIENRTSHSQSSSSNFKTPKRTTIMRQHLAQVVILLLLGAIDCHPHIGSNNRLPAEFANHHPRHQTTDDPAFRVFYGTGMREEDLPICSPHSVCNKVDTYDSPWIERQCRCPGEQRCSMSLTANDGHTITDKMRQFKMCEPVKKLPKCRFFRDVTWTYINYPDNSTQQVMHCQCPKNSVAYIIKRQAYESEQGIGYQYSFACSPQSRLRCQRKEPCRLFTAKKRADVEEVNTNSLCQCPHGHKCPRRHTDVGVVPGKVYTEDLIRTYSAYCI